MSVAVVAAGAGVIVPTVHGCLDEAVPPPGKQQQQTTQMMMGITTKNTKPPTATPTIMPTTLTTPRGLEWVIWVNIGFVGENSCWGGILGLV